MFRGRDRAMCDAARGVGAAGLVLLCLALAGAIFIAGYVLVAEFLLGGS